MAVHSMNDYRDECIVALNAIDFIAVGAVTEKLLAVREAGRMVFIAGNGGSATTASHMATDLMLGSQLIDPPLRIVALTDNQAVITATGNDVDFDQIFARQFEQLAQPGDLLITVSASGNSPNLIACLSAARRMNVTTVGFTGFDGGQNAGFVDLLVHLLTRIGAYGPVEDVHLAINHMITEQLKEVAASQRHRR